MIRRGNDPTKNYHGLVTALAIANMAEPAG